MQNLVLYYWLFQIYFWVRAPYVGQHPSGSICPVWLTREAGSDGQLVSRFVQSKVLLPCTHLNHHRTLSIPWQAVRTPQPPTPAYRASAARLRPIFRPVSSHTDVAPGHTRCENRLANLTRMAKCCQGKKCQPTRLLYISYSYFFP